MSPAVGQAASIMFHVKRMDVQPHRFVDYPFACPPDIVLDLPAPLSVNKVRRINWREHKRAKAWRHSADGHLLMAKANKTVRFDRLERFEINIILNEQAVFCDADNAAKLLIDYLCGVEIIKDDAPKNMRKVTIEWGWAPTGCRVIVRPCA